MNDSFDKESEKKLIHKLDLWKKMQNGNAQACIDLTIMSGVATSEDFEFTKEEWFKEDK